MCGYAVNYKCIFGLNSVIDVVFDLGTHRLLSYK